MCFWDERICDCDQGHIVVGGRRGRQSLEPLLATPAPRGAIVSGKMAAAGGIGKVSGVVLAAFIIGVMNNGMSILGIGIDYQQVIKGIVLLAAVCLDVYNKKNRA